MSRRIWVSLGLVALVLAAVLTGTATATRTAALLPASVYLPFIAKKAQPNVLYFDDFSNPASGWQVADIPEAAWGYAGGEYFIRLKKKSLAAGATSGFRATDFALEVDGRMASVGEYGLIFGLTDTGNFYEFGIGNDGYYGLWKFLKATGEWPTLIGYTPSPAINQGTGTNRLRVERQGSQIRLYVNGQSLASVSDSSFTGNLGVGLLGGSYDEAPIEARFDNFRVLGLGGAAPSAEPWGVSEAAAVERPR